MVILFEEVLQGEADVFLEDVGLNSVSDVGLRKGCFAVFFRAGDGK